MDTLKAMKTHIGTSEAHRKKIVQSLSQIIVDYYSLYLMTQMCHWNVTGPSFQTLHLLFEKQYEDIAQAIDVVAERIRMLGFFVSVDWNDLKNKSSIKKLSKPNLKAEDMLKALLDGHESALLTVRKAFPSAEKGKDESTLDFLTHLLQKHEKVIWVLRSLIG